MKWFLVPRKMFPILSGLMLASASGCRSLATKEFDSGPETLPLFWRGGLPHLEVEINGTEGFLQIDTGCVGRGFLYRRLAPELGVELGPERAAGLMIGGLVTGAMGRVTGRVSGVEEEAFPISGAYRFLPLADSRLGGKQVFGVLGLDPLQAAGAVVNLAESLVRLHPDGDYAPPPGWHRVPLFRRGASGLWMVQSRINGQPGLLIVDTCANGSALTESFALKADIEAKAQEAIISGMGHFEDRRIAVGRVRELTLGDAVQMGGMSVLTSGYAREGLDRLTRPRRGDPAPVAGLLGADFLVLSGAVLDLGQGILYLPGEPPPNDIWLISALRSLASVGDHEAREVLSKAGGRTFPIPPAAARTLIARARDEGWLGFRLAVEALHAAGDMRAGKFLAGRASLGLPEMREFVVQAGDRGALEPELFRVTLEAFDRLAAEQERCGRALEALARDGDAEAAALLAARRRTGRLPVTPAQGREWIERAEAKGLLLPGTDDPVAETNG